MVTVDFNKNPHLWIHSGLFLSLAVPVRNKKAELSDVDPNPGIHSFIISSTSLCFSSPLSSSMNEKDWNL